MSALNHCIPYHLPFYIKSQLASELRVPRHCMILLFILSDHVTRNLFKHTTCIWIASDKSRTPLSLMSFKSGEHELMHLKLCAWWVFIRTRIVNMWFCVNKTKAINLSILKKMSAHAPNPTKRQRKHLAVSSWQQAVTSWQPTAGRRIWNSMTLSIMKTV